MTPDQRLGEKIRTLREFSGMTQEQMGKILGIHQAGVSRIEDGTHKITAIQLQVLAVGFDVKLDEFFEVEP